MPAGTTGHAEGAELARALAEAVAGRMSAEALGQVLDGAGGAPTFVARSLREALAHQDWDAVEVLLPYCCARPDARLAEPLAEILDRQSLEISNVLVVQALGRIGTPEVVEPLRRAASTGTAPTPDWAAGPEGDAAVSSLRAACREALEQIEASARQGGGGAAD